MTAPTDRPPPTIAIIMRAKDEMPHARRALAALRTQTRQDWKLYAIDSGSTDGTLEQIQAFPPDVLIQIAPADYEPGPVLNRMVGMTAEPLTVFLNADAIPLDDHWLARLVEPVEAGEAEATMSVQVARADADFIVAYDYARAYDPKNIKDDNEDFFSAVACAFPRTLWEKHRFKDKGYSEDLAWARACRRDRARFKLITESRVEHSHNFTIPGLHRKRYRHGRAFVDIFGARPRALRQTLQCAREIVRDLLYTVRRGRFGTIPFNLAHRYTIHRALYLGMRDECRERGVLK
ncbi:MAG: glycosyltransferase family 2 protein [Opitutales bacterium]|nr:glycosyltransferase family 2 protein [Opitutales bacterium]